MRTGFSYLPLHNGSAPKWLFDRMVLLSNSIVKIALSEYGSEWLLKRVSNPFWFQSLGCALGYDWHSSGLSTVLTAVLKESINTQDYDIKVCGGKGKTSLSTPTEIDRFGSEWHFSVEETENLKKISRLVAKTDNALVQDGYTLYHHSMFITKDAKWAVVQQGMNERDRLARRYHWIYDTKDITLNPNRNIDGSEEKEVLDMTSLKSVGARDASLQLISSEGEIKYAIEKVKTLKMPYHHIISPSDISEKTVKELSLLSAVDVSSYEDLVLLRGVGPKTIRALALLSELVYGEESSWEDPVKFSYAHGGKDGTPYRINLDEYDETIQTMESLIEASHNDFKTKEGAIKRLHSIAVNILDQ